jgi:hypothetical protein
MADQKRDDLESNAPDTDEEARGLADDEFEDSDEEDVEDEEQFEANERLTGEVGSEGGSPGETVVTQRRGEAVRGSEAGETWSPEQNETRNVERVGEEGAPKRRNP